MGRRIPRLSCLLLTIAVLVPRPALAQSGVVAPTDNLVTDGLPPVPAAIAEAARPYSEFRAAGFWDWHPTRRTGRDLDLWVVDPSNPATDHMALELQGGGYGPLDWSPDGRTILLGQAVSVNESYLWLVDVASGQKTRLAPQPSNETVAYGD